MTDRPPKRTMTTFAVGLLLLDGVLLLIAAWYLRNWGMAVLGLLLVVMAGAMVMYYRRYTRTLAEVQQAREALKAELAKLRELVNERDKQP